ncbi:nucleoside-diphosphate kinase [Candidatus Endomicrobiellum devescovinae]|jgi:nucleoside-diphosphate kinase|uniref:nucleoside-diphosphate kinase n=1 Tax=Candidatus Endomicrobiellum devescovinae TaxID=3242322 RepID=UPI0028231123|nr:nucleoside-diphosphate kinase [Endomicrobium sp.]MDR1434526.1 nucleoside-diphosphate kinase [Endomicrobium sp.]
MAIEQLLILIKPDGVKKSLTGNILTKLSEARMLIIGAKTVKVSKELAEQHYYQLKDKPFFGELVDYIQGKVYGEPWDRVLAFVYQGEDAIARMRKIAGATNPEEADPVSIRGAYGRITTKGVYENVVHCSSDPSEAEREIKLWFKPEEIVKPIYPTKKVVLEKEAKEVWA